MCDEEYEWEDCTGEALGAEPVEPHHTSEGKSWYRFKQYLSYRIAMKGDVLFRIERRVPNKPEPPPWEPKVGEWVEYEDSFCEGRGKIISGDIPAPPEPFKFAVADPARSGGDWHNCGLSNDYTRLFPNSCRWFHKNNLKPVEK